MNHYIQQIQLSPLFHFRDWPNKAIPLICPGVYTVYDKQSRLLYVGMAGAELTKEKIQKLSQLRSRKSGLYDRLNSHASGYRSGDRFNIYICDLYVMKKLSDEQINAISSSRLSLDSINKEYIRSNLSYRYLILDNTLVRKVEHYIQSTGINGVLPLINGRNRSGDQAFKERLLNAKHQRSSLEFV